MTGTDNLFENYYKSSKLNVVKMFLDVDKITLDEYGYNYKIIEESTPYVLADKKYNNMASFTENTVFYKQYFDSLEYSEKDGIITIEGKDFLPNDPDDPGRYYISDMTIAIESKYKVIDNNANSVDKDTNTYYWNIDNDTTDFKLLLSFDSNTKFNPYINEIIMIIVSILIVIITWLSVWYFYRNEKKKKKNKNK